MKVHVVFRLSWSITIDNHHSLSLPHQHERQHWNSKDIPSISHSCDQPCQRRQNNSLEASLQHRRGTLYLRWRKQKLGMLPVCREASVLILTSLKLVGANKRGMLFFSSRRVSCWPFLTLSSVVFMTSIILLPSKATRNSCFMILLGLKVEMSGSFRMFWTSLQSMQRQQKSRISFMLSGQFLNPTCCLFWHYPIGSVSHLILQGLFLD